jgi:plasmid stabilization system protein ParE
MAFEILIKPIVWFDLEEAITWYENESPGLGKRFFKSFVDAKENIVAHPTAYINVTPTVKRILLKNFPYKLFYTIAENTIYIIGVAHAKRSNAFIRRKLKQI